MSVTLRSDRAVLRFSGRDAQKLLNDVITGHVEASQGPARWWALLSAQGKIQAEGLIGWAEDAFWLDVHNSVADDFFKRMRLYKLRAEVTIEDKRATHRVGWSPEAPAEGIVHADARAEGLGFRVIDTIEVAAGWDADITPYLDARIAAGIPEQGADFPADSTFAHDAAMDILGGIDFDKGCYVGQEVVSRMKHRGTARRRPVIATIATGEVGMPVLAGERDAGAIGAVANGKAVGIVRLDRITDSAPTSVGGQPAQLTLPAWATYAFGESAANE
ncbi:Folate-dependent protein for Fe/S cluster synthesi s/repair in oxidative stress [Devosia sp. DBB001]|nr:Folate-dependent protein for Fe/S cluster synthesi s/repair in oxidative stress [Devosia sp. DBB001]